MVAPTDRLNSPPLRLPPQDLEVEKALLGCLMIKPDGLTDITDVIHPNDFYSQRHNLIFRSMLGLAEGAHPIDIVTLTAALKEKNKLEAAGGGSYLAELLSAAPAAGNLKYYAEILRKKSALRRLIGAADQISELGYNEHEEIDSVFDRAEKAIFGLANFSKRSFISLKDSLVEAWERFEHLHKSDKSLRGVPIGFTDLDNKLSGLQKSDLIILAARPSMGKTSLALDIARHVACREKIPVGIFSLEMSSQQLVDRLIAAESHVDSWKLRTGRLSADEEFARIRDALDSLAKAPIFIDDDASNNIVKMKSVARRLKSENGLGLIIVDYLQLMVPRRDSDSLVQQVTEISRSLKGLARELEVPVLALSQLNRAVEQRGGRPRLSDLRDSGSIEQDADVVMFIHREDKYNEESERKNIAEILIEKHRNGPTGKVELFFDEKRVCFTNVDKSDFGVF
ncbi:MAG: replicative DNA helicase [Patescibacteria group bacterium]